MEHPETTILGLVGGLGALSGLLPLVLLFIDYRKRGQIHKPLIYLAVFAFSIAIALPLLLKMFGIWLALIAPFAVMIYVLLARRWHANTGRDADDTGRRS